MDKYKQYMKDEIVEQVIDKYHIRSDVGIKKYGTKLEKLQPIQNWELE